MELRKGPSSVKAKALFSLVQKRPTSYLCRAPTPIRARPRPHRCGAFALFAAESRYLRFHSGRVWVQEASLSFAAGAPNLTAQDSTPFSAWSDVLSDSSPSPGRSLLYSVYPQVLAPPPSLSGCGREMVPGSGMP